MTDTGFTPLATRTLAAQIAATKSDDAIITLLEQFEHDIRDNEARAAADRVEALPYLNDGRTVNRGKAILAARRNLTR